MVCVVCVCGVCGVCMCGVCGVCVCLRVCGQFGDVWFVVLVVCLYWCGCEFVLERLAEDGERPLFSRASDTWQGGVVGLCRGNDVKI